MHGINTIDLNPVSMQRAIQHYLRTVLFKDGNVEVYSVIKNGGMFEVRFEIKATK